ncbi:DUF1508 domain-containing protein [Natrarchaeobaculum sulfurireducens]|uniref:DUF1508 domain-containing protein n=1 Tax=Natrarchaeobaculum sulfurireducens TaxID=2044521 RepID=A0A346PM18_9EURY|nr:DUF1508 domain-containing protein [Natrarchaeobaculum sulfurireducens]AXR80563.1 hypothetical protein AArcMg_0540 [Natrarchaeobaculum sulfurireducens]
MSSITDVHQNLFRLYERYVGEPDSSSDVYGYWLFILGYLVAAAGVLVFVVSYAGDTGSYFLIRVSTVIAGTGATIGLFGIVLLLPVRKRGIQASVVGLVIALAGVAFFAAVYPHDWRGHGADYSVEVIAVYSVGIGIIAGVTALVPVVTGQRGMFVEEVGRTEDPPVMTGDALEGAQFAVFRDETGDWKWHVLHLEALAASTESAVTRPDATDAIERVQSRISSAGLLELTTSAFRLYEDRDGSWQWTLARDDGSVVGACADEFTDRDAAEESVSFLKDRGSEADVIEIDGAAFTYETDRDRWYWTLIDDERTPLARGETGHGNQKRAEEAAKTFADRFDGARVLDVEHVGVELYERADEWAWRFVDDDDEVVADSVDAFDARRDAEEAVEALLPELESAAIVVAGDPAYELYATGSTWRFRLVDETETIVARDPGTATAQEAVAGSASQFSDRAREADVVEIDDAEYEVYPAADELAASGGRDGLPATADEAVATTDGGTTLEYDESQPPWHWRLVTEDREVVAASTQPHGDAETASEAIERVREQASEADLIEFEHAAFQVYEADSGEWRWRLIDEDGNVLADSGQEHTSRGEAAEAMMTLKEEAPEAELLEIETAAFELFVDENDEWGWRLIDEGGKLVAEDPATHPTRGAARKAMNRLLEHLDSDVRTMERPIFQPYAVDDWHWRFVLPSGETVAISDLEYSTRDELVEDLPRLREVAAEGRRHTIGDVAVQLYGADEWRFRLLDRDREKVADATVSYPDSDHARTAVEDLEAHVADAPVFSIEDAVIRLEADEDWHWRLVDREREVIASSVEGAADKDDVFTTIDAVRQLAPMAGRVDFDVASFELAASDDGEWRWRLLDGDGRIVATGTETYDSSEAVREALSDVRGVIESASIIEIDEVSFELHAADDGDGWVWQLIDEYGTTMAESTKRYETRTEAREAMNDVKAHAPDGWITFTD